MNRFLLPSWNGFSSAPPASTMTLPYCSVMIAAGLDAAGRIDLVAPQLIAPHQPKRVDVERAGLRGGEADGDRVLGESRRRGQRQYRGVGFRRGHDHHRLHHL